MSEDCCATGCGVREGSCPVRSSSAAAMNVLPIFFKESTKFTNFYQINLFCATFPGKQVASLTLDPTYFRAPSGLFRRIFFKFRIYSIFSGIFPLYDEKYLGPLKYPFKNRAIKSTITWCFHFLFLTISFQLIASI